MWCFKINVSKCRGIVFDIITPTHLQWKKVNGLVWSKVSELLVSAVAVSLQHYTPLTAKTTSSLPLLNILNFFTFLKSPPPAPSLFVSLCSSPLPYPAWGERTIHIQGQGGGSLLSGPPAQWLFIPGLLGHQHDNVTMRQGFLKEILCLLSVFFPLKSGCNRRVRRPEKCLWKNRANFDQAVWKGWTFWLTWARGGWLLNYWMLECIYGKSRFKGYSIIHQTDLN